MAGIRFNLDLFIQEDPTGTLMAGVKIPSVLATKIPTIRQAIRDLKVYASKINEEMTIRATYHICYHNEIPTKPCGAEQEI